MAPKRKARLLSQQLSRLGALLLVPVAVWTSAWLLFSAQEEALPTGLGLALGLVTAISVAAGLLDCFGLLACPLGFLCCGVFLVQLFFLMVVLLVSMSTGPAASPPPSLLHGPGRAPTLGSPPQQQPQVQLGQTLRAARVGSAPGSPPPPQQQHQQQQQQQPQVQLVQEPSYALSPNARLSVILACAGEGDYAVKTAVKVVERTPSEILEEVVVVDDGSSPPLRETFAAAGMKDESELAEKRIRILRHPNTLGLMIAKKTGGDNAKGDILVFFDCHVSPQARWYEEIRHLIVQNPKRMVVPAITDLDLDTWEEKVPSNVNTKTYLTWQADFDWFDDASPFVPVMSGGLLALSSYWWNATGGYDSQMRGWGGENLDQSLRSWLCGGEIMLAKSSRVAHMWRTNDRRTMAHYRPTGSVGQNKRRVVAAWFDKFQVMYDPSLLDGTKNGLDLSEIQRMQKRLHCKPFVHFLHRFRDIYVEGAIIPRRVFQLREKSTGLCMTKANQMVSLTECRNDKDKDQLVHWANRVSGESLLRGLQSHASPGFRCCSGIRFWSSDLCLDFVNADGVHSYLCDVTGRNQNQQYRLDQDLRILHQGAECLRPGTEIAGGRRLSQGSCQALVFKEGQWEEMNAFEPTDARLYREGIKTEGLSDPAFLAT